MQTLVRGNIGRKGEYYEQKRDTDQSAVPAGYLSCKRLQRLHAACQGNYFAK
jgi:hypothetical protein